MNLSGQGNSPKCVYALRVKSRLSSAPDSVLGLQPNADAAMGVQWAFIGFVRLAIDRILTHFQRSLAAALRFMAV